MKKYAFTLIELLVVIVIIGILATISVAQFNNYAKRARDAKRLSDMSRVHKALELYAIDHDAKYPSTGSLNTVYVDPTCAEPAATSDDLQTEDWIPDFEDYIPDLPQNPQGIKAIVISNNNKDGCYMYSSDGDKFVLSAWGTIETGVQTDQFYMRLGYRELSLHVSHDIAVLCNHENIGGNPNTSYVQSRDYYKHSYTISNKTDCSW